MELMADLTRLLGHPRDAFDLLLADGVAASPAIGDRVEIWWPGNRKWYPALVKHHVYERGTLLTELLYDAGAAKGARTTRHMQWHDLTDTEWRDEAANNRVTQARMGKISQVAELASTRQHRLLRAAARRMMPIHALVWENEFERIFDQELYQHPIESLPSIAAVGTGPMILTNT